MTRILTHTLSALGGALVTALGVTVWCVVRYRESRQR